MRLTSREKEIIEVLKKEPLISQDELAGRFGITRSSVAVHISNLMKKGVILGKGYVFNEQVSVVIFGESCMRIEVRGENENTRINVELGGFALDTARALAKFGLNVKVITVLGNDVLGTNLISKLQESEIDTANVFRHPEKRTCRRISANGRLLFEESFTPTDYEKAIEMREWVALNCQWLITQPLYHQAVVNRTRGKEEDNLPCLCTYQYLANAERLPESIHDYSLYAAGVGNAGAIDDYLEQLTGLTMGNNLAVLITDGTSRAVSVKEGTINEFQFLPNQRFPIRERLPNLAAGLVYGLASGYPLRQAVRIGIGSASGGDAGLGSGATGESRDWK